MVFAFYLFENLWHDNYKLRFPWGLNLILDSSTTYLYLSRPQAEDNVDIFTFAWGQCHIFISATSHLDSLKLNNRILFLCFLFVLQNTVQIRHLHHTYPGYIFSVDI